MKNPFLAGHRVYLRPLEHADAPSFVPWLNDIAVRRHLVVYRPTNLASEEAFIEGINKSGHDVALAIVERNDDRLIGVAGLHRIDPKNRQAAFGIFIGRADARNRGLGTEATALIVGYGFDTLNMNRIWLHVYEDNVAAVHVYEKLGFKREGLLREDYFREGRYWNTVVMGILRSEWVAPESH
jgi:[ribosomal protein S5]-alanine N-acetyltransferase